MSAGLPRLGVRLSIRLDFPSGRRLGPGKIRILELIEEHGSISAAGRALNMSYRRAWKLVDDLNTTFLSPLVLAQPGGPGGGGATLTQAGQDVLCLYRQIQAQAAADPLPMRNLEALLAPHPPEPA